MLVGFLDMTYAFLLFWPANSFPIWIMVSLLQLFIPLNMLIRYLTMELRFQRNHYIAGGIILAAIVLNLFDFAFPVWQSKDEYMKYVGLFIGGQIINNVSMAIKEHTVRSLPVDQQKFTFAVSLS